MMCCCRSWGDSQLVGLGRSGGRQRGGGEEGSDEAAEVHLEAELREREVGVDAGSKVMVDTERRGIYLYSFEATIVVWLGLSHV